MSTTDLKGRITYCNPAFIEVSGYAREELLGQPHNLIRHPDMPEEAFRDLWATVSSGRPWSACVKNRRKDGDHYWVIANVTPLVEDGRPVGYMSVRSVPKRDEVAQAETLYRKMNAARRDGRPAIRLDAGRVRHPGWRGWMDRAADRARASCFQIAAVGIAIVAYALGAALERSVAGFLLGAALGAGAGTWMVRALTRPLSALLRAARLMAAGDLRHRVEGGACGIVGELQAALAQLNVNLQAIVGDARSEVVRMERSIAEIAEGNLDMSGRTESQAGSLQQTAASMEEITGTVRQGAEAAQQASTLADGASDVTQRSMAAMHRVSSTMQDISEASRRIADISGVIDGISFQTNLLALNAAVEAARVGEQGRGFGVVAGEVRALAQRSAQAAREIRQLIETAQSRIASGVREADMAADTIGRTADSVSHVTRLIHEISHGASEQLSGIAQVNQAVAHLDGITQQNVGMVERLSASAAALRSQAQTVSDSVRVFHTRQDAAERAAGSTAP
ncbi:MAG TPA: methyl-accepting chemotaxis protein [Rhizobacter sp.]